MTAIVETKGLTKRYRRETAVQEVNLTIRQGSVYGLLGPNGAGKTTILKLLLGLLHPTSGEVELFGEPWSRSQLAKIGALIETPALYGNLTGRENLQVHQRLLALPPKRIDEVLSIVGLTDVDRKKRITQYSLGMKQRLGIAIALLDRPSLLILDEPTNGLDPVGIREMRTLIHSFAEQGITVVVASHILGEVAQIVDDIGILNKGKMRYQGSLAQLMEQGQGLDLEELFFKYVDGDSDAHFLPEGVARK